MHIRQALDLILYKTYTDLKAEAERSYLGLLWWLIEPILYLAAFYILFVLIMKRGGPDFVPMFLCGAVVWKWFDSGIKGGAHSISANAGLLQQVYVPKYIFPINAVLNSTARFVPVLVVFCLFLMLYGKPIQVTWFSLPILFLTQLFFVFPIAMIVGAITPFFPDIKVAIDNGMMFLFFISGVFFNINEVHEPVRSYLLLNPMAGLIDEYRNVLMRGQWPDLHHIWVILLTSLALTVIALMLLKKLDHKYGKVRF